MTILQQFVLDTLYKDNEYAKRQVTILINCISSNNEERDNALVNEMLTSLIVDSKIDNIEEVEDTKIPKASLEIRNLKISEKPSYVAIYESLKQALVLSLETNSIQELKLKRLVHKLLKYPNEFHKIHECLLKYVSGHKSAIDALSQHGFAVKYNLSIK